MGLGYSKIKKILFGNIKINYSVIENSKICKLAENLIKVIKILNFIRFYLNFQNFDIIYISSALQYIDDWEELLEKLKYNPKYFVFENMNEEKLEKVMLLRKLIMIIKYHNFSNLMILILKCPA